MGRLTDGAMIILFLLLVGAVSAFMITGAQPDAFNGECTGGNATECAEDAGESSFFDSVSNANPSEIDGAPDFLNGIWLLVVVFLFALAVILIALAFVPTTSE